MAVNNDKRSEEPDEDKPEVEEVITDFGDVRVRSGFEIEEVEPGVVGINIFGPIFEFLDDEEDDDLDDLELGEEDHE